MKSRLPIAILLAAMLPATVLAGSVVSPERIDSIAFGSCAGQNAPQPVWDAVHALSPDVFLLLGDNVYADTSNMDIMRAAYDKLAAIPGFQKVRDSTRLLATWDDHDYGANDAGAEFPAKYDSEDVFENFFGFPDNHPARSRDGVYSAWEFGPDNQRVQIILLDTRFFRSPLKSATVDGRERYVPNNNPKATLLGDEQWNWLAKQFQRPATVRIVASSIQFIPEEHDWEKWANIPAERQRFLNLINKENAGGVVLVSGDRHLAEISRLDEAPYPLYEVTSSSLNRSGGGSDSEPNQHRVAGNNYRANNFGHIKIDWNNSPPTIRLEIRSENGKIVRSTSTKGSKQGDTRPEPTQRQ